MRVWRIFQVTSSREETARNLGTKIDGLNLFNQPIIMTHLWSLKSFKNIQKNLISLGTHIRSNKSVLLDYSNPTRKSFAECLHMFALQLILGRRKLRLWNDLDGVGGFTSWTLTSLMNLYQDTVSHLAGHTSDCKICDVKPSVWPIWFRCSHFHFSMCFAALSSETEAELHLYCCCYILLSL